jgi:cytochrome c oxidase assembly protein subunit 15
MGGLVTSHEAGMSVPDWPNSWGYNMFLFPPRLWIGGILYEHTHRLMATVVGMLAIALTIVAWMTDSRRKVQWLCTAVLGAVIFQGVLGGLRVVLVKLDLAIVHACIAQAFFCLAALAALMTSRWWSNANEERTLRPAAPGLILACVFAVVAIYAQLVVGATMRHYQAGLAVPDFPLAYGRVLPATDSAAMKQINQTRIWKLNLPIVTANQVRLNLGHRAGAAVVSLAILLASGIVLTRYRQHKTLLIPAIALPVLLAGQITLGAYTVLLRKPADIASLHVAVGALTLLTTFILCTSAINLFAVRSGVATQTAEPFNGLAHEGLVPA